LFWNLVIRIKDMVGVGSIGLVARKASATSGSYLVSAQGSAPRGVEFSSDGTKMYVCDSAANTVCQYTLSSAWNVNSASYANKSFDYSSQDSSMYSVRFKTDGTKMYLCGFVNNTIYQYTLSSAWDVSSASYASKSFAMSGHNSYAMAFKTDGTKVFIGGTSDGTKVYLKTLSTAWDISTATATTSKVFASVDQILGIDFKSDGTKIFLESNSNKTIYEFSLGAGAWDITGSNTQNSTLALTNQDDAMVGVTFGNSGTNLYCGGNTNDKIFQYGGSAYDLSTFTF
jgi:DNA-binding beta-propeller fold protein YncE